MQTSVRIAYKALSFAVVAVHLHRLQPPLIALSIMSLFLLIYISGTFDLLILLTFVSY